MRNIQMFRYLAIAVQSPYIGESCLNDLEKQSVLLNEIRRRGV